MKSISDSPLGHYVYDSESELITFENGTQYNLKEAIYLAKKGVQGADLEAIHILMKVFEGDLDTGEGFEEISQKTPAIVHPIQKNLDYKRKQIVIEDKLTKIGDSLKPAPLMDSRYEDIRFSKRKEHNETTEQTSLF